MSHLEGIEYAVMYVICSTSIYKYLYMYHIYNNMFTTLTCLIIITVNLYDGWSHYQIEEAVDSKSMFSDRLTCMCS